MNDNQLSLVGNIVRDPVLKRVSDKSVVTNFRLAATPRRFDSATAQWVNLETVFLDVSCWNKLAERVAACLRRGDPVSVSGRLRMRTYEVEGGAKRTAYEVDAQLVAPDLNRVSVEVDRAGRRTVEAAPDFMPEFMPERMTEPTSLDLSDRSFEPSLERTVNAGPLMPLQAEPAA